MHVLGGYHEIVRMAWDEKQLVLSGEYRRAPGLEGKAYLYVPDGYRPLPDAPRGQRLVRLSQVEQEPVGAGGPLRTAAAGVGDPLRTMIDWSGGTMP